ncbi:hypothetical protein [Lacticaseibacillus manihotivorans]|uniref:hypothetical protein n=1 Tax=Lacticaseibacillus manihotivorans TaxID=88233 RepID=UPI001FB2A179|nr:hypothetical protein [Lacticaseibacillus manihotivorans]
MTYQVADDNGATATAKQEVTVFADKPTLDISKIPATVKMGEPVKIHDVTASSKYGDVSVDLVGGVDSNTQGNISSPTPSPINSGNKPPQTPPLPCKLQIPQRLVILLKSLRLLLRRLIQTLRRVYKP